MVAAQGGPGYRSLPSARDYGSGKLKRGAWMVAFGDRVRRAVQASYERSQVHRAPPLSERAPVPTGAPQATTL
jgi:hypothetical protein